MTHPLPVAIRPGRDSDAEQLIGLIGTCWAMYPGIVMDVDGEIPELRALATWYARAGGALWVADDAGVVIGMAATRPFHPEAHAAAEAMRRERNDSVALGEICRVYVHPSRHGTGLAHSLLARAEAHAAAAGATRLVLWTDTRFHRAHRFYEKRGYVRTGAVRALHDISRSYEYEFSKSVR